MSQIEDLVAAYRILAEHNVIDAYGHVSVRSERDPIDPKGRESVRERYIHGEVFKARPEVMSVVHSHSHTVVPFSVTQVELRPVFHMAAFVGEGLPNFEIRDVQTG